MSTNDLTFTGDFPGVARRADSNAAFKGRPIARRRAGRGGGAAARVLMMTEALEGWAVQLARWLLELGATGRSNQGAPHEFLAKCGAALDPPATALIARARVWRRPRRDRPLSRSASPAATASSGLPKGGARLNRTRYYWTALHRRRSGRRRCARAPRARRKPEAQNGRPPLHVAVRHRSWRRRAHHRRRAAGARP